MLKERAGFLKKANIILDSVIVISAFALSFHIRDLFGSLKAFAYYDWLLLFVIPVWLILLDRNGFYSSQRYRSFWSIVTGLATVTVIGGLLSSSVIYMLEPRGYSRSFFITFLVLSFLMLAIEQLLVRHILRLLRLEGYNYRNVLLVGTGDSTSKLLALFDRNEWWGIKVAGVLRINDSYLYSTFCGTPVLGSLDDLASVCKSHTIDEVIFCDSKEESRFDLAIHIRLLDEMGITSRTVLNSFYSFDGKKEVGLLNGEVPLLTFRPVSVDANQLFYKRCLDIVGSLVGLTVTVCLLPFIALAVKLESRGPVLFGQTRVRENGRTFTCWKFRSMYQDAEARKQELMHLNEMEGAIFKMKNDPRVTRVGAFLRKTSLDELPQFWNVLVGEMSLVGTRPPTPAEVAGYLNWQRKRICMKPGITGLWQVSGRNSITDFDDVVKLDLEYIDSWSIATDIRLILRTIKVVFFREGAC